MSSIVNDNQKNSNVSSSFSSDLYIRNENGNFIIPEIPNGGIVLIDKPKGITSFGVVARVRRKLSSYFQIKKIKVGHTGTLDPFATGLMVILYGKQTKRAMELTKLDKIYQAEFILGSTSTTGDIEGEITEKNNYSVPKIEDIDLAKNKLTGKISQTPPSFSAIKINGKRAEIPSREVEVYDFTILDYNFPSLKVQIHCSSGTYIRTISEDLGNLLGCEAYCKTLRRINIADFNISSAFKIDSLEF